MRRAAVPQRGGCTWCVVVGQVVVMDWRVGRDMGGTYQSLKYELRKPVSPPSCVGSVPNLLAISSNVAEDGTMPTTLGGAWWR